MCSAATTLIDPPIAADVDLRRYPYMPFFGEKLLKSDTWLGASDHERVACIYIWWAAWQQVPAGSLPGDERMLAQLAGRAVGIRAWRRMRERVLRGFVPATDGRLYHPVLVAEAIRIDSRRRQSHRAVQSRWSRRTEDTEVYTDVDAGVSATDSEVSTHLSQKCDDTSMKTERGNGEGNNENNESNQITDEYGRNTGVDTDALPAYIRPKYERERDISTNKESGSDPHHTGVLDGYRLEVIDPVPTPATEPTPAARLAMALRPLGVAVSSLHPLAMEWAETGVSIQRATEAVAQARRHIRHGPIPARYLHAILTAPAREHIPWHDTDALARYGFAHGCAARPGEDLAQYRDRLRRHLAGNADES